MTVYGEKSLKTMAVRKEIMRNMKRYVKASRSVAIQSDMERKMSPLCTAENFWLNDTV